MDKLSAVIGDFGSPKHFATRDWDKNRSFKGDSRRSYEPIRRSSRRAGHCEGVFWRSVQRKDMKSIVLATRKYELKTKEKGRRNGALGHIAIEVLDYMTNLVDYRTGRLEPSLDYLMKKLCRSRDAIVRALKALRFHGFIDWIRRYEPTGAQGYGQPKYRQTSNAYRLSMPKRALRALQQYYKPSPTPDDFTHAQEQHAASVEDMLSSLSREDFARVGIEDPKLAETLAKFGRLFDKKRESAKQSESPTKLNLIGKGDRLSPDIE